jgi:uncharacterized SAM-binding protein YcdF (DUF218 family)
LLLIAATVFFIKAGSILAIPLSTIKPADLIVILGGETSARSIRGLELYHEGLSSTILLTGIEYGELQTQKAYLDWRAQFLISSGVPKGRILFDLRARNSWEEAENTLVLMKQKEWRRVIVVSDPPHLRRVDWVWGRIFKDSGIEYSLSASHPSWWDEKKWWRSETGMKFVTMEYLKIGYYLLKY